MRVVFWSWWVAALCPAPLFVLLGHGYVLAPLLFLFVGIAWVYRSLVGRDGGQAVVDAVPFLAGEFFFKTCTYVRTVII